MKRSVHHFGNSSVVVFEMTDGEKVTRHQHPHVHYTGVVSGTVKIDIDGVEPFNLTDGDKFGTVLPANIEHEITAVGDAIICNITNYESMPRASDGGITLCSETAEDTQV